MEIWKIVLIAVCSAAAFVLLLLFLFAVLIDKFAFGRRADKNPLLKYFTADDFGLTAKPVCVNDGKTVLRGFIYSKKVTSNNLIIFCHGMGPGHIAYTTEINYFCGCGYTVLAIDYCGSNMSDGKNIKGIYSGVRGVKAAIDFARSDNELQKLDIYLVGHSWGGYSALCASAERKVCGVVAMGAPDTPAKTITAGAAQVISKPFANLLKPFICILYAFKFGRYGNLSAAKCADKNGVKTLLIHGDKDNIVAEGNAALFNAHGKDVTKYIAEGKGHNPYNTVEAQNLLSELTERLMHIKSGEDKKYFETFDFKAATEEDYEVMKSISDFIG
ncbi:MAG: lysophospholipase [Clostridia bacterium]|nr:lysophospholipase [Clostridia bacterium]